MVFKVILKEGAIKDLELHCTKQPFREVQRLPTNVAENIFHKVEHELPASALQEKQLKGKYKGLRRMRVGDYRVIFEIRNDTVVVLQVTH